MSDKPKLFIVDSEDWTFWYHRRGLYKAAEQSGYDVKVLTNVDKYKEVLNESGISFYNIKFIRSAKSPLRDIYNIYQLVSIYKREKPDVIHNIALKTILVSSIASYITKSPVTINAFTGLGFVFSSNRLMAKIIRFFIKPVLRFFTNKDRFWTIFQNTDDMNLFQEQGYCHPQRTKLIRGSGVDMTEFSAAEDTNQIPVVMLASRMLWDKGVGEFIEVAKRMKENNVQVKFVLVGENDPDNPMSIPQETLESWDKADYVSWKGHSHKMPEMLASSSIVCLPSYREGLPKVLLEAASIARPLVATDVPGCREIVKSNENGILVKMKDVDSLYEAILKLVQDRQLRERMGIKSREIVEAEFSSEIINEQILGLYSTSKTHATA